MQLHEFSSDRQSETRTMVQPRGCRIHLRKLAEDQIVVLWRNSHSAVADFDEQLESAVALTTRRVQPYAAIRRREVDCVPHEVAEDMRDLLAISNDMGHRIGDVDRERQALTCEQ